MEFITDFHIHSKYSRATSKEMNLEELDKWAKIKGIKVLACGDFTHPAWFKELKEKLEPAEQGLYRLKNSSSGTRFILTVEISCIYSKPQARFSARNGFAESPNSSHASAIASAREEATASASKNKVRKIHVLIFAPSLEAAEKINAHLGWRGNLKADGRPILGLDAKELAKIVLSVDESCLVVPAHCMTPWFGIFGSKSGFDSIEECFEDYSKYIYAVETGLSADPKLLWLMPDGQKLALISNSDSHSPRKIGREANVFDTEVSYPAIVSAIKSKDPKKFLYTVEFFPEEGKYHYDGHRLCCVSLAPAESKKSGGICPACGKPLTIGVLNRVEELSNRPEGFMPQNAIPFKSLVPLEEIIAEALGVLPGGKQVESEYKALIEKFGSEFAVLLTASPSDLENASLPKVAEGIARVREGKIQVSPGYDGVYGKVKIFSEQEQERLSKQKSLF